MSMTTTPSRVEGESVAVVQMPTLGWALRRTALAIVILAVFVTAAACLFYAAIDADEALSPPASAAAP
jgi:hypothetical protein